MSVTEVVAPAGARSITQIMETARSRLSRVTPRQAQLLLRRGAVLVDIRPVQQRHEEGEIPGAVPIERNVLEWRLDPASDARLPIARYNLQVVVICSEGYTPSLAAAALLDVGLTRATDVIGGIKAWRADGLPIVGGRS